MQIYIAKPGSTKEGPFTLDQINGDLAARKYSQDDYWAWHEGMPQWVPLYEIPGVSAKSPVSAPAPAPLQPAPAPKPVQVSIVRPASAAATVPAPEAIVVPAASSASIQPSITPTIQAPAPPRPTPAPAPKPMQVSVIKPAAVAPAPAPEVREVAAASPPTIQPTIQAPAAPRPTPAPAPKPIQVSIIEPTAPAPAPEAREVSVTSPPPIQPTITSAIQAPAPPPPAKVEPAPAETLPAPAADAPLPLSALEQIFIFTSGEGRTFFQSQTVAHKLHEFTGEDLTIVREKVHVDIIGHANVGVELMLNHQIPQKAWRAMFSIRPVIAQGAKDDQYQVRTHTFTTETTDTVAALLFYNKQKLSSPPDT